jgi:hypothetical protein
LFYLTAECQVDGINVYLTSVRIRFLFTIRFKNLCFYVVITHDIFKCLYRCKGLPVKTDLRDEEITIRDDDDDDDRLEKQNLLAIHMHEFHVHGVYCCKNICSSLDDTLSGFRHCDRCARAHENGFVSRTQGKVGQVTTL